MALTVYGASTSAASVTPGYKYTVATTVNTMPTTSGQLSANSYSAAISTLYLYSVDANGLNIGGYIAALMAGAMISVKTADNTKFRLLRVLSLAASGNGYALTVTQVNGIVGTFAAGDTVYVDFDASDPAGSTPVFAAVRTADLSRSSTTAYVDDTQLKILNVPVGTYSFETFLNVNTGPGALNIGVTLTGGSGSGYMGWTNGTGGTTAPSKTYSDIIVPGVNVYPCFIQQYGSLIVTASGGTFSVQWGQVSSNPTATILLAGSLLRMTKVA